MAQIYMFDDISVDIDLGENLTGATNPKIIYKKPDGTIGTWVATTSGNVISYLASNGELDMPGHWQFEGRVTLSGRNTSGIITQWIDKPLDA